MRSMERTKNSTYFEKVSIEDLQVNTVLGDLPNLEVSADIYEGSYKTYGNITIVLPTLNEEKAIEFVIDELKKLGYRNIFIVDGHSSDKTVEIAKSLEVDVLVQPGRGKADAIKAAVTFVKTPYMLVMDADATYDPKHIDEMLNYASKYDEVIGARVNGKENISAFHRFGNWVITNIFNLLFGTRLKDVCSGMYLLRTEVANEIDFESPGFSVEVEVAAHVCSTSRRIQEFEIDYRPRIGECKLKSLHGISIILSILKLTLRYNPVFLIFIIGSLLSVPSCVILGWVAFELLRGINHFVWATIGVVGAGISIISVLLSVMALYMKRMEYRLISRIRRSSLK